MMLEESVQLLKGGCLESLKKMENESVDLVVTSPPYWSLRDYGVDGQIGNENTFEDYIENLLTIFKEVYRVLKKTGSCWVNIGDVYSQSNNIGVKKQSLICIPDRFKLGMINSGWLCRNEIIWHKPNAMPSSSKTRFNNDYEKMFFFTKSDVYYFETQYEEAKTKKIPTNKKTKTKDSKYINIDQESSVRQGMNKSRGNKLIEVRPKLPNQEEFVTFIRGRTNIKNICENSEVNRTKAEHWFRRDKKGFAFPSIEDWNKVKYLIDDFSEEFQQFDEMLTYMEYETDDIYKNIDKGRIKRAMWSINTKPFKGGHFAPFPQGLVETPIKACCPPNGVVMDIFMGSGTTGVEALKQEKRFIGLEINEEYIEIAKNRIENMY